MYNIFYLRRSYVLLYTVSFCDRFDKIWLIFIYVGTQDLLQRSDTKREKLESKG